MPPIRVKKSQPYRSEAFRIFLILFGILHAHRALAFDCVTKELRDSCASPTSYVVTPGSTDSSGVFLACNPESKYSGGNLSSCQNLGLALIANAGQTTINIVAQKNLANTEVSLINTLSLFKDAAKRRKTRLNIILTSALPGDFIRDSGLALSDGLDARAALMPDLMGGARGLREALAQCSDIRTRFAYRPTLSSIFGGWMTESPYLFTAPLPGGQKPAAYAEGGNVLGLPGGFVVTGESRLRQLPDYVDTYFKTNKHIKVRLPEDVGVGLIDEIFNLVPSRTSACGYAILAASPRALKIWAEGAGATELAIGNASGKNETWSEVLNGGRFPWKWHQKTINQAKSVIWKALREKIACREEELFVDVPMGWDIQGRPYFSNPVNGINLNGAYLYSRPLVKLIESPTSLTMGLVPATAIENLIRALLISKTAIRKVVAVDTIKTDGLFMGTGGNVHCLTLNFPTLCSYSSSIEK